MPASAFPTSTAANLRAALSLLLALRRQGLRRLVLCPGSRSAPLAVAAGMLERHGLQLLTGVDERSAAFLALGLGRVDGMPAAVVTTSGTAVANLLPAAVEADSGSVPLLLLTADRPVRLKGCGANQTVNQEQFLAASCRACLHGDGRGLAAMDQQAIGVLADRAWAAALETPVGPVHLNLPFEEPLHAGAAELVELAAELAMVAGAGAARAEEAPKPVRERAREPLAKAEAPGPGGQSQAQADLLGGLDPDRAGVVVAGPWRGTAAELERFAAALLRWQRRTGWPVLADGLSGLRGWPGLELVAAYDLLLAEPPGQLAPPQLLRLGPMPASRRLQQWIAAASGPQLLISEAEPRNLDATGSATVRRGEGLAAWLERIWPWLAGDEASAAPAPGAEALAGRWRRAEGLAQAALDRDLNLHLDHTENTAGAGGESKPPAAEPALARALSRLLPAGLPLMLASSSPVRDWESFADPAAPQRRVHGFRGASGIDGTLSIAAGLALAEGELVLLTGDLALLHDANGWLWRRQLDTAGCRLTVVLVDNGGGGIFEQLPIRPQAEQAMDFERLFAMPQTVDHGALAAAHGVPVRALASLAELGAALSWAAEHPMALIELRTDRRADALLRQRLRATVARQLASRAMTRELR
ncbi:2-succinyl-5-enolpyruvyl-6-hydroxy-3-cyclohexene-1-carboxylic-acid synthase [Vulcanococcus limneticus]|uniref:2-succinyl-5-enolpyruvyl-6-hydroxy-3- cyclohexene-1-carboxylic-acid synthase n=1 Tax=Vulcanococcus limneticus TaxID=2170428 RepID=UPI00398C1F0B